MAAAGIKLLTLSVIATAALTQFRAVTAAGALPAAGARSLGVADFSGAIGDRVSVGAMGAVPAETGAAVTPGAALEVDALGRFIPKNTGVVVAHALGSSTGAGQVIEVLLVPN